MQSALGTGTAASTAFDALKDGARSTTVTTLGSDGTTIGSQITTSAASGGKVGTFTFSGSEGESQRFSVGTATNLGVNASASSTQEYQVNSNATLGIGTSQFRQTIGTSGSSQTESQRELAAASYAQNAVATEVGNSASSYYEKAQASASSGSNSGYAWWNSSYANKAYSELSADEKRTVDSSYSSKVSAVTERATSEYSSSSASQEAANGVISGSFKASSAGGPAPAASNDSNEVTVKGIGNSAALNAASNSNFSSTVSARPGVTPASNSATASGGAGANMSSTSSADASATNFSSIFIQSF
jgi:hypothetical protein